MAEGNLSDVDKIAKLVRSATPVKVVGKDNRVYAVPDGVKLVPEEMVLRPGLENVASINRYEKVTSPASFVGFIKYYGSHDTIVFLDEKRGIAKSIINYIPHLADETDSENIPVEPNSEERPPEDQAADVHSFRCDWQISFENELTSDWNDLVALTASKLSKKERALLLIGLKESFSSLDDFEEDDVPLEFQLKDNDSEYLNIKALESHNLLTQLYEADLATSSNLVDLILGKKSKSTTLLMNFNVRVHTGTNFTPVFMLVRRNSDKERFEIIGKNQLIRRSKNQGISMIRSRLASDFNVFDADLQ